MRAQRFSHRNWRNVCRTSMQLRRHWRRQKESNESEDRFQKVFRSSPVPFSITTYKEGKFVDLNAAFERRYGYSREELVGHTVHELRIWEDPADRAYMLAQLQRGGPIRNIVTRLRTKSGEIKVTAHSADKIQSMDRRAFSPCPKTCPSTTSRHGQEKQPFT